MSLTSIWKRRVAVSFTTSIVRHWYVAKWHIVGPTDPIEVIEVHATEACAIIRWLILNPEDRWVADSWLPAERRVPHSAWELLLTCSECTALHDAQLRLQSLK